MLTTAWLAYLREISGMADTARGDPTQTEPRDKRFYILGLLDIGRNQYAVVLDSAPCSFT
ncbi:hypothetical protein [Candidatus Enterovibrio escicola]|uniref:Uncharacterized protein n=1 Tax=Candidatus Enterovibrio escicola TaxID=1927127 RepID=A0A2A5T0Q1_9GAMM|nr:hypothetical protein [Candidatus Enterovibrio escacola]PCS21721.1 hypothetical protein BTN49_2733 [Candidatus Enterovibrio escacola]